MSSRKSRLAAIPRPRPAHVVVVAPPPYWDALSLQSRRFIALLTPELYAADQRRQKGKRKTGT